ncbi:MAG: Kae1-associated serine/threonine protein kinase [Nanoarchaeota archaeon]|nr:Kae1-associated serine/threonine protein kinase [Nanoarchaeota archaeon]
MKTIIGSGAEATIYLDGHIIKDRIKKSYRIHEIDDKLRKQRTKREAKVLRTLQKLNFPAPKLLKTDDKERIEMQLIEGAKVRDILEKSDYHALGEEIGKKVAILHNEGIIHGDLTTSNMILDKEIYFIDFGLSFFSEKVEDKAVDLHLLRQALESKHYTIWHKCFLSVLKGYKAKVKNYQEIHKRYEKVEERGRNKHK